MISPRSNNVILTLAVLCVFISTSNAFVTNSQKTARLDWVPQTSPTRPDLSLFHAVEGSDNESDEEKRMEMVRSLQKSFYAQGDPDEPKPRLQEDTGIFTDLPLWRVGWVELPGRANCLNVHEGQYTHMFETILNGPKPWYVGHLHLPGGFKMTRTEQYKYKLKTWKEEIQDNERFQEPERSAVVGTLMQISDYRRLTDGRLVLLTQVLERFVVQTVVQEFPYSVAHVQILPDTEEVPTSDENFCKIARAAAICNSFDYHEYECAQVKLPLVGDSEYLSTNNVVGEEIAKLLPFAFYSRNDSLLVNVEENNPSKSFPDDRFSGGQLSLEQELVRGRILRNPPSIPGAETRQTQSTQALETLLWLALEEFCQLTDFQLPDEVLCLMPPNMDYLDMKPPKQHLSERYPSLRRQRRLSYTAAAFLENTELGINLRQNLLNTPSTQGRLSAVLERFECLNVAISNRMMGEYQ